MRGCLAGVTALVLDLVAAIGCFALEVPALVSFVTRALSAACERGRTPDLHQHSALNTLMTRRKGSLLPFLLGHQMTIRRCEFDALTNFEYMFANLSSNCSSILGS